MCGGWRRPVTPEAAGSSPVDPAILRSPAASYGRQAKRVIFTRRMSAVAVQRRRWTVTFPTTVKWRAPVSGGSLLANRPEAAEELASQQVHHNEWTFNMPIVSAPNRILVSPQPLRRSRKTRGVTMRMP
jgi:hypothetical protein